MMMMMMMMIRIRTIRLRSDDDQRICTERKKGSEVPSFYGLDYKTLAISYFCC